jgi:hypothetical protein
MGYRIKPYTQRQAKKIGVTVKVSRTKGKKIDVFKNGKKIGSVGATGYKDYPTYMELEKKGKVPKGTAKNKRKAYKARHVHRKKKWTNAWLADQLLW